MTSFLNIVLDRTRISMKEIQVIEGEEPDLHGFDKLQPKYDGWFALAVGKGKGKFDLYSRSARLIGNLETDRYSNQGDVLIGEYMYGTNWSQTHFPMCFVAHDIYFRTKVPEPYINRYRYLIGTYIPSLNSEQVMGIEMYDSEMFDYVWGLFVEEKGFEGLVAKNSRSIGYPSEVHSAKIKRSFAVDYICLGVSEGKGKNEGRLGALIGGLYREDKLVEVCSVGGGFSDEQREEIYLHQKKYIGKVFEASGKGLFDTGALRHPNFNRWRFDKPKKECVWKNS